MKGQWICVIITTIGAHVFLLCVWNQIFHPTHTQTPIISQDSSPTEIWWCWEFQETRCLHGVWLALIETFIENAPCFKLCPPFWEWYIYFMIFLHSHKLDIYFIFLGASASKKHTIYTVYMIKIILSYTCITAFSRLDFYGLLHLTSYVHVKVQCLCS